MFIFTLITVLIVLVSIALIFVVMIQNSKGGGLAAGFSANNNIMGVRKTTDVVEKATWWLVTIVTVLCVASTAFYTRVGNSKASELQRAIENRAATTPVVTAPAFDASQATPTVEGAEVSATQTAQPEASAEGVATETTEPVAQ